MIKAERCFLRDIFTLFFLHSLFRSLRISFFHLQNTDTHSVFTNLSRVLIQESSQLKLSLGPGDSLCLLRSAGKSRRFLIGSWWIKTVFDFFFNFGLFFCSTFSLLHTVPYTVYTVFQKHSFYTVSGASTRGCFGKTSLSNHLSIIIDL